MKLNAHQSEHLLRSIFDRLELAGIAVSPADYVRIGQMLSQIDDAEDIPRLKFLISPILASSESDQHLIHQVFDEYVENLNDWMANDLRERERGKKVLTKYPKWISYLSFPFLFLALLGLFMLFYTSPDDMVWSRTDAREEWRLGDTVLLQYQVVESDISGYKDISYKWGLENEDGQLLFEQETDSASLDLPLDKEILSDSVRFSFGVYSAEDTKPIFLEKSSLIPVLCAETPVIIGIERDRNIELGEKVSFYPLLNTDSSGVQFYWTLSGNEFRQDSGAQFDYVFMTKGSFTLEVKAVRGKESFYCESSHLEPLEIEVGFPDIPEYALVRSQGESKAFFKNGVWIVWGILFFITVVLTFLYRRRKRYRDKEWEENQKELEGVVSAEFTDKPPYSIEFRSEEKRIRTFDQRFLLSRAMHKRNEKPGFDLDLGASISETLDRGGFPSVRFKTERKPNQFLFLIHQEHKHSHDARLFEHLAHLMEEDEVLMLTMFYRDDPSKPYNADYPNGISINQLKSKYGEFRVLLFTEGEELINDHYTGRRGLRPGWLDLEELFIDTTIVSPVAAEHWGYTESRLYEFTDIFPADLQALIALSSYLEHFDESMPRPLFKDWKSRFTGRDLKSSSNFDHFRHPEKYLDLLGSEALYDWFLALSIHSKPNWDLTLSIGRALETDGFSLSFDNILKLSRIPALHEGEFHPALLGRMRLALQEKPLLEEKARRVLKHKLAELSFVQNTSFAADEYEVLLAKNDFILAPDDHSNKHRILLLMKGNRLNKLDTFELIRHSVGKGLQKASGKQFRKDKGLLEHFLEFGEVEERREMKKRYSLVGWSLNVWLLFLLYGLHLMLAHDNTRGLELIAKEHQSFSFMVFSGEDYSLAERRNNEAVDVSESLENDALGASGFTAIGNLLEKALSLQPDRNLFRENTIRNIHNSLVYRFSALAHKDNWKSAEADSLAEDIDSFVLLLPSLDENIDDYESSSQLWGHEGLSPFLLHFMGLLEYYQGDRVTAYAYRDSIFNIDSSYFSLLDFSPHLLDLLPVGSPSQFNLRGKIRDTRGAAYGRLIIQIGTDEVISDAEGNYELLVNNPELSKVLKVDFRKSYGLDNPYASQYLEVGNSTEQSMDFVVTNQFIDGNPSLGKEIDLYLYLIDEEGTPLNGVQLLYNKKSFEVNGNRRISFKRSSRTARVELRKKGYRTKTSIIDFQRLPKGKKTITMKRKDVRFSFSGNINDSYGQGLRNYIVEFGDNSVKTKGTDGRFSLDCTISAAEDIPTKLIIRNASGDFMKEHRITDSNDGLLIIVGSDRKRKK